MPHIKIDIRYDTHGSKVWIDGQEVQRVRKISFEHVAGEMPVVDIEIIPHMESDIQVECDDITITEAQDA